MTSNTTIITQELSCCPQTGNPEDYDLALGESYEQLVARYLTQQGLTASRMNQVFIPSYKHHDHRHAWSRPRCPLKLTQNNRVLPGCSAMNYELLRPFQIDLRLKVSKVRQLHLEIKGLTPGAFRGTWVHIGKCPKYDLKQLPVHKVVLVNQLSKEFWVCPPPTTWVKRPSIRGEGYDYAVPRSKLSSLDAWVCFFKVFYLGDHSALL